jgi:tetratricopeptide (TPR) repeat protein
MSRRRATSARLPAILLPALLIATFVGAPAGGARAGDDAGGRSLFATGAGNRALALGSAYAALADDASGSLWNPGGLGWVTRRELQASHTDLVGLGFGEQFAGLVVPNWRWGAAAVTFRRFGAGGIDRRDERNLRLGDEIEDSETELGLAYGHRLGAATGVGAAVKLRWQSLAGYSDAGIGLDVGLLIRPVPAWRGIGPASDLTVGLALRNLAEPALRLDQETVRDPFGARLGAALTRRLGGEGRLVLTADVERTRDMDARLQAGCELQPLALLALRAGLDHGSLTAGAAVRWNGLAVDYVFADTPLEPIHRIGISLMFGPTVAESREAALGAREAALQARLAAAFDARRLARADSLAARAQGALAAGRPDEAREILGLLRVLEPDDPRLAPAEVAALRAQAGRLMEAGDHAAAALALGRAAELVPGDAELAGELARCRAEGDRLAARSLELRGLFSRALDAFAADSLQAARERFARVVAAAPDDREAADMLRRTETAIAARTAATLAEARRSVETPRPAVGGTAPTAAAPAPRPATPPAPAPLSAQRRREIEDLYRRGLAALDAGRPREAVAYWELVWSADPAHARAAEALKREHLTLGMEAFAAGRLDEAATHWQRVLQIDPGDRRAAGYLERAREQQAGIRRILGGS